MNNEVTISKKGELELYYTDVLQDYLQDYGVSCKCFSVNKYTPVFSALQENFVKSLHFYSAFSFKTVIFIKISLNPCFFLVVML